MLTLTTGQEVTFVAVVKSITSFFRKNFHSGRREMCLCITLAEVGTDTHYVTFTGDGTKFGHWALQNEGVEAPLRGKFKRHQEYDGNSQVVVTHVKRV